MLLYCLCVLFLVIHYNSIYTWNLVFTLKANIRWTFFLPADISLCIIGSQQFAPSPITLLGVAITSLHAVITLLATIRAEYISALGIIIVFTLHRAQHKDHGPVPSHRLSPSVCIRVVHSLYSNVHIWFPTYHYCKRLLY